jgi:RHS repeat-associated protein
MVRLRPFPTQLSRAFECTDMTVERLELTTEWGVQQLMDPKEEGEIFYYHQNHQGSPSFISTTSGFLTEHLLLLAYGEVFASNQNAASWQNPYSFTGKEQDMESGLHYFGARYYLAEIGMWLSTDPLADQFANVSPYAYAANNPAFFTDRWGLAANPPAWWSDFQGQFKQLFPNAGKDGETRYGGYSSVVGEITAPRMTWAERQGRRIADDIRNMPTMGLHPNLFFQADAIFADVGLSFIGIEGDIGFFFVLTGNNKGEFHFYYEGAGGGAPDASIGFEIGRVDVTGSNDFELALLYGDREKYWLTYSPYPFVGIGSAVSYSQPNDSTKVFATSFQGSVGTLFPFSLTGGYNSGKILK